MDATLLVPILAAAAACASIGLLSWGVMGYLSGGQRTGTIRKRLSRAGTGRSRKEERGSGQLSSSVSATLTSIGSRLGPRDGETLSRVQTSLIQAGSRSEHASAMFHGAKAVLALLLAGCALGYRTMFNPDLALLGTVGIMIGLALVGSYLPEWWLRSRVASRRQSISDEMPDALDLLVVCVEAGMGLDQAIHRVSEEMAVSAPCISEELRILTLQLRAGKPRPEAMRELSERVGLEDLNSLTTLLIQADIFGISVAQTLRVFSDALRTKRFQRAEEKAAKLPVKMLVPMIMFILPALFIAIMGPAGLHLMDIMTKVNK